MNHLIASLFSRNRRAFFASLLSYLLIAGQMTPLVLASNHPAARTAPSRAADMAREREGGAPSTEAAPAPVRLSPVPAVIAPNITATKVDSYPSSPNPAQPGEVITYTVQITNNGTDATNVTLTDTVDPNTTIVPGSAVSTPIAVNDTFTAFGNVRISTANGAANLLANDNNPNTGNNTGLTASGGTTSTQGGNVVINSDGSFSYNPPPGYTGPDSFTYTATSANGTNTATVNITVGPTLIWFINNTAAAGGDGRITTPFNSIAAYNASAPTKDPNDIIFIYTGASAYTGNLTLVSGMKVIGQGFALQTETGAPPAGSDPLPAAGAAPTIDNPGANIITLGLNNTLRGFNTGNSGSTGTDISGTSFGTLTVSALSINGDGRALNLTTGTLAATVGNISASNTGANIGLVLTGVGGALTVSGTTTITNPGGNGIDISNAPAGTTYSFGTASISKNAAGACVNITTNNAGATTSFTSLTVTNSSGAGITTNLGGTLNASAGSITTTGPGVAASFTNTALGITFTSVSSNGGANGLIFSGGSGTFTSGTTNLQNNAGIGLSMSSSAVVANFGNTTVNSSAGDGVDLLSNTGTITFADLDITPDAGLRAFDAQNNTGTITSTSGDVSASGGGVTVNITGASAAARTPLAMVLTNLDSTNSTTQGVNLNFVSGNFTVNDPGTATDIQNPTGVGIQVQNTGAGTINFGNTTVNGSGGTGIVLGTSANGNTGNVTFAALNITPDAGQRGLHAVDDAGTITTTSGTITTPSATAVEVNRSSGTTPIAMTLTSVSSAGGAPNGIILNNTSGTGFTITGTGAAGSGGTIANKTGADGSTSQGTGIFLNNAANVSLTRMQLNDFQNFAIRGIGVSGFTLASSVINGVNGTSAGLDESSVSFDNLTGSASITSNTISGGFENNLRVINSTGTLNRLTATNNTFGTIPDASGQNNVGLEVTNGTMNVTFTGNTFTSGRNMVFNMLGQNPSTSDVIFRTNNISNNNGNILSGGGGVTVASIGAMTYDISCNKMSGSKGAALNVTRGTGGTGTMSGTIFNNRIGLTGIANSGSSQASGIQVASNGTGNTHTTLIKNNQIRQYNEAGIFLRSNNGNNTLNATIIGNLTVEPGAFAFSGLYAESGAFGLPDTNTMNLKIGGSGAEQNDFTLGDPANASDVSLNAAKVAPSNASLNLTRPPSVSNDPAVVVQDNNTGTPVVFHDGVTLVNSVPALPAAIDETCAPPAAPINFDAGTAGGISTLSNTDAPATSQTTGTSFGGASSLGNVTSRPFVSLPRQTTAPTTIPTTTTATRPATTTQASGLSSGETIQANPPVVNGQTLTFTIGNLPAGESVTITFQVTINNPFPTINPSQVSNQGTVTADGGVSVLTDDPDVAGSNNPTITPVVSPPDIIIKDASGPEPASGSSPMAFTVILSKPAPAGGVTVNFTTADNPPPGAGKAVAGVDYTTTSGTLTFAAGQSVQTISVPILSDADAPEPDETFLVNLTGATGGNITDSQAVGTITTANPAGALLISELRTFGPSGASDEFVEVYNNTGVSHTVADGSGINDAAHGYGLFRMGATCTDTPVLLGIIPNGTIIPARGHYLFVGSQYSLATSASGNLTMTSDIPENGNVGLFITPSAANLSTGTRLDAVGFGTNIGNNCDLLREGNILPAVNSGAAGLAQHSFYRSLYSFVPGVGPTVPNPGFPSDRNNNAVDFLFVDTNATNAAGLSQQRLGAPGPENLTSPIVRDSVAGFLLDGSKTSSQPPNRTRDISDTGTNKTFGTLSIRRRFTNNTGAPITRLRFRVVELTTFPRPDGATADVRGLSSVSVTVSGINDSATCAANGTPATAPCSVTVQGTTLEAPTQPNGGGYNSTMAVGNITGGTPLANGASVSVQFLLGIEQTGSFRYLLNIEALP